MSIGPSSPTMPTRARSLPSSQPPKPSSTKREAESDLGSVEESACDSTEACWTSDVTSPSTSETMSTGRNLGAAHTVASSISDRPRSTSPCVAPGPPNTLRSAPGSLRSPRPPALSRPESVHLRSPTRRKPVPSIISDEAESNVSHIETYITSNSDCGRPSYASSSCCDLPAIPVPAYSSTQCLRPIASRLMGLREGSEGSFSAPLPEPKGSVSDLSFSNKNMSASSQSRPFVLPVDPPMPTEPHGDVQPCSPVRASSSCHYHTNSEHSHLARSESDVSSQSPSIAGLPRYSMVEFETALANERAVFQPPALAFGSEPNMREGLPQYAPRATTEPKTLAATLWLWGFCLPVFWAVGMFILWSPLRIDETETDPEKQQKIEEMLAIVRKTELKYARRCAYSFVIFCSLITVVIITAVVVSHYPATHAAY